MKRFDAEIRWLFAVAMVVAMQWAHAEEVLYSERSLYRNITVYEDGGMRCMAFGRNKRLRQSCIDLANPDRLVFSYLQSVMGALYLEPAPKRILIIGLGGGALTKALVQVLGNVHIDVVEIDPAVVRVATKFFDFVPNQQVAVVEEDGRVFVRRAAKKPDRYDLIILDAFDNNYIPEHMLTQEFLQEVKCLLAPHGVLAANTFSGSRLYDSESKTYAAVYGQYFNLRTTNRVILTRADGLPDMNRIRAVADALEPKLKPLGVSKDKLLPLFKTEITWPANTRLLTDQYSPSNLLNN